MPLPLPNLDDRDFHSLLSDAQALIRRRHPAWTDLGPHDPGMVLLEAFSHLTDLLLYRLNQVPDKVYIALLRLIGVELHAPTAAVTRIELSATRPLASDAVIPRGTRVTSSRGTAGDQPPVFTLAHDVRIPAGGQRGVGAAYHADFVRGEVIGRGTGAPGLALTVQRPPIVAASDDLDVVIGTEMTDAEDASTTPSAAIGDKRFRLWREVDDFARYSGDDPHVFTVDRVDGVIRFAPAVAGLDGAGDVAVPLGAIPAVGREIRAWYWRGGGGAGNVAAESLRVLKDPIAGITANNLAPATGGRDVEQLDNALARGPLELFSLERAVTAQDFETIANRAGVARSLAFASRDLWAHAKPGSVDLVLVPQLPVGAPVTLANLQAAQSDDVLANVLSTLDGRQPIGTQCRASWARFKPVRVEARVVVHQPEAVADVHRRVVERLRATINPLPGAPDRTGWRFGEALRASHVYEAILAVPGVRYADSISLVVDHVPEREVTCLRRHPLQRDTWFAAAEDRLFRSQNNGASWELVRAFAPHAIVAVDVHTSPAHAGMVAVATNGDDGARVFVSEDSGETWAERWLEGQSTLLEDHEIRDLAWTARAGEPVLFVGTDKGLYRQFVRSDAGPELMVVDARSHNLGIDAVVAVKTATEEQFVAAAAAGVADVYVSTAAGDSETFFATKLRNVDVGTLHVQYDGLRTFLWAGARVVGNNRNAAGCYMTELSKPEGAAQWRAMAEGWHALSCHAIDSHGSHVFAASHDGGVLRLDVRPQNPTWVSTPLDGGLPLDPDTGKLRPVHAVAVQGEPGAGADPAPITLVLAGGPRGIFASATGTGDYQARSRRRFDETVTIPPNWLLCSAEHDIRVEVGDAAE